MKIIPIIAALFAAAAIPAAATMTTPDDKPKVASASAAPTVTVEPISSVSVGGPGKVVGDFCTAPMLSGPITSGSEVLLIHVTPDGRIGDVVPEPGTQHTKRLGELVQAAKSMCLTPATGKPRVIKAVYFLGSGQ